jgi:cutinase
MLRRNIQITLLQILSLDRLPSVKNCESVGGSYIRSSSFLPASIFDALTVNQKSRFHQFVGKHLYSKMLSSLTLLLLSVPFISAAATNSTSSLGSSTTENGLTNGTGCKAMTVIFARGVSSPSPLNLPHETTNSHSQTTEQGNVGTLTGPPFFAALAQVVGINNLAVQGVDYPADIPGFLAGGDANGSMTMAQLVGQAVTQCPTSKVVVSGYSQGGQLVHNAAKMLNGTTAAKVSSGMNPFPPSFPLIIA